MAKPTPAEARELIATENSVSLLVAAVAFGIAPITASRRVADGNFPVPTVRIGHRIAVPTPALRKALQIEAADSQPRTTPADSAAEPDPAPVGA
jgi:hypothetical protein